MRRNKLRHFAALAGLGTISMLTLQLTPAHSEPGPGGTLEHIGFVHCKHHHPNHHDSFGRHHFHYDHNFELNQAGEWRTSSADHYCQ